MFLEAGGHNGHAQLLGRVKAVARMILVAVDHGRERLHHDFLCVALTVQQQHTVVAPTHALGAVGVPGAIPRLGGELVATSTKVKAWTLEQTCVCVCVVKVQWSLCFQMVGRPPGNLQESEKQLQGWDLGSTSTCSTGTIVVLDCSRQGQRSSRFCMHAKAALNRTSSKHACGWDGAH